MDKNDTTKNDLYRIMRCMKGTEEQEWKLMTLEKLQV